MIYQKLSDREVGLLQNMIGKKMGPIYSSCIMIDLEKIAVFSPRIVIGDDCLQLECEWMETEVHFLDHWRISIDRAKFPASHYVHSNDSIIMVTEVPCFVGAVEVFESEAKALQVSIREEVNFDSALLFYFSDGGKALLAVEKSVAERFVVAWNDKEIETILGEQECRLRLQ